MSSIEWTDETWNPVVGCTAVSPGCLNCYAARMARRLEAMGKPDYLPRIAQAQDGTGPEAVKLAVLRDGRPVFTGDVRLLHDRLMQPLRWKRPRKIFVNSMSDLFHEDVPFAFVDQVFVVMALCPHHTFQILTKRPRRMLEYLRKPWAEDWGRLTPAMESLRADLSGLRMLDLSRPLPNVHIGTSAEDQDRLNERLPDLLECPAEVRFLSLEPLLGPVCLAEASRPPRFHNQPRGWGSWLPRELHWVICGGESGPRARPCRVAWLSSIVKQCRVWVIPCFVKQLGSNPAGDEPRSARDEVAKVTTVTVQHELIIRDAKGADMDEWPADLRCREQPVPF